MGQLFEFALHHSLLVGATALMLLAALLQEWRMQAGGGAAISPAEAVRLINGGAQVIDLREPDQFRLAHIVDATNVVAQSLSAEPDAIVKKKRTLLLVCDKGGNSARTARALREAGYANAFSLEGGIAAWERENLPTVAS